MDIVAGITRHLDGPMVIVTARAGDRRSGCLVGFSTQCSIRPPRWLVCISEKNATYAVAEKAAVLAVHFLAANDLDLAELFGGETEDETEKFDRCAWHDGPDGVPVLDGCPAWLAGPVVDRRPVGDHTAMVVEVAYGHTNGGWTSVLGYQAVRDLQAGHTP